MQLHRALSFARPLLAAAIACGSLLTAAPAQDAPRAGIGFAEGTSDEAILAAYEAVQTTSSYILGTRWPGTEGTPATVTWSLMADGVVIPSLVGEPASASTLLATLDARYATSGGRAAWVALVQSCFDRWSEVCGINFVRVSVSGSDTDDGAPYGSAGAAGLRGDIRIGSKPIDGASGVLTISEFPLVGDVTLDSAEVWESPTNQMRFLRNCVAHALGHSIGISNVCSNDSDVLMEPIVSFTFDGPQHDDVRASERLYGDPFENDDGAATAVDLGTLAGGTSIADLDPMPPPQTGASPANTSIRSLDHNGDQDWIKFRVNVPSFVSVQVSPRGFTYQDFPWQFGTGCGIPAGSTNSIALADLRLELRGGTNGSTTYATAASQPIGSAETLTNVQVPGPFVYVRVLEDNSPSGSQLYSLSITVQNDCAGGPDCNANSQSDACDIALGTSNDMNGNALPDECEGGVIGTLYCFGDQSDVSFTPCPCDNAGTALHGCANSQQPTGAQLWAGGTTSPVDTVELQAVQMPASAVAIFLKGDVNAPLGAPFGDGVRCVDGNLIRLGARTAVAGATSYPGGAGIPVSVRGQTPVGSGLTGYYQAYYRNAAAAFCPPETFNVTNGTILIW